MMATNTNATNIIHTSSTATSGIPHHTLFAHDELDSFLVQELEANNNSSIVDSSDNSDIGIGIGTNTATGTPVTATATAAAIVTRRTHGGSGGIATAITLQHSQQPSALPVLQPFDTYTPSSSSVTATVGMQSLGLPSPTTAFDPRAIKATSPYYSQLMAPGTPNGAGNDALDVVDAVDAAGDELLDTNGNVTTLEVDVKDVPSPAAASVASGRLTYTHHMIDMI